MSNMTLTEAERAAVAQYAARIERDGMRRAKRGHRSAMRAEIVQLGEDNSDTSECVVIVDDEALLRWGMVRCEGGWLAHDERGVVVVRAESLGACLGAVAT